jgi:peptide/nickel transport system substrate-binding protein
MLRPNALYPPFSDKRARQALNYIFEQADQMSAGYGDESIWQRCNSFFICGGPYGIQAGAEDVRQDFSRARELLKAAGYKGEKLTFVSMHDIPWIGQQAEVAADALKRAGVNVDMVWSDWGTTVTLMNNQAPPEKGGWNLFLVTMTGPVMVLPLTNPAIDMSCERRNFWGWPCDAGVEQLRDAFIYADEAARPAALEKLHQALADASPYRVLGQAEQLLAFRREISGVLSSPVVAYWNIGKEQRPATIPEPAAHRLKQHLTFRGVGFMHVIRADRLNHRIARPIRESRGATTYLGATAPRRGWSRFGDHDERTLEGPSSRGLV